MSARRAAPAAFEVLDAGVAATIQDLGRPGHGALGVPRGGAADRWALRVANALLGNAPGDAALEVTGGGAILRASEATVVALAGADLGAEVDGWPVPPGRSVALGAGATLAFRGARHAGSGFRAYLAVPGGFDVPVVLGARATLIAGRLGGLDGRALRGGDRLRAQRAAPPEVAGRRWFAPVCAGADPRTPLFAAPVALVAGPDTERAPDGAREAVATLLAARWTVAAASDRIGLRLDGPALPAAEGAGGGASFGVLPGFIQVPPDGAPILLLADHQTVGGYPVIAAVASVDLDRVGEAAPGDALAFVLVDREEARRRLAAREAAFEAALAALEASTRWDDLHLGAGA